MKHEQDISPGQVVGWIQGGRPQWSVVTGCDGRIAEVATTGRSMRLNVSDIAVVVDGTDAESVARDAASRAATMDAEALWRGMRALTDGPLKVAAIAATLNQDDPAALWLAMWQMPELFERRGRTQFVARDPAAVALERERRARLRREQQMVATLDDTLTRLACGAWSLGDAAAAVPEFAAALRQIATAEHTDPPLPEAYVARVGRAVTAYAEAEGVLWPPAVLIAQALGWADPWRQANPRLAAHQAWLAATAEPHSGASGPPIAALTDLMAIDDAGTTDRDDAVGLAPDGDGWIMEVAVADTTAGFAVDDHVLDAIARIGTSVYLPTATVPMVPDAWGAARHSLDSGVDRPVFLVRGRLGPGGAPSGRPEILRGRLTIPRAYTYDELDAGGGDRTDWPQWLALAEQLAERRYAAGAERMDAPDVSVVVSGGHPVALREYQTSRGAHLVVREWMVWANTAIADALRRARLPAPYRVQPREAVRQPAVVQLRPGFHSGLGVAAYVYATSPIRRFSDVLAQRQLAALLGDAPAMDEARLHHLAYAGEGAYQEMKRWMALASRYWKLRWLEAHPRTPLMAVPLELKTNERFVRAAVRPLGLVETLPARAPDDTAARPVRLIAVDAERGTLVLDWDRP